MRSRSFAVKFWLLLALLFAVSPCVARAQVASVCGPGKTCNVNRIRAGDGTVTAPSFSWWNDTNTGLYRPSSDAIGVSANGAAVCTFRTTGLQCQNGSGANPSINFVANSTTGMYHDGTAVSFAQAGAQVASINTTGLDITTANASIKVNGALVLATTAPTISAGFGTSPSISGRAFSYRITIGSGGVATNGSVTMPAAATGWNCRCTNFTSNASLVCVQCADGATSISLCSRNYAGAATAFNAADVVHVTCDPF